MHPAPPEEAARKAWRPVDPTEAVRGFVYLLAALIVTRAAWGHAGWPINHEFFAHFERVETFRRAYQSGDWFPLWTPFSNEGHGSPMPFFYHRLFNTIASLIAFAAGSSYVGVKVAVVLVTYLGAWGTDRALKVVGASSLMRLAGVIILIGSPYALTDWLVRGATAEYSAFMLMPWLFAYCLRVLRGEDVGGRLGATLAAMFYAHNAICYFALYVPLVTALLCGRSVRARRGLWRASKAFVRALAVFLALTGPYVAAITVLGRYFNLKALNQAWSPLENMQPLRRYFYDPSFDWGHQWKGFSVEIGVALSVALILGLALAVGIWARHRRSDLFLLGSTIAVSLFLQTPAARFFYRHVPGAMFLGFPWRLLAMTTTAAVILLGGLCASVSASARGEAWSRAPALLMTAAALYQVVFAVRAQGVAYGRYSRADIEKHLASLDVPSIGEYLPVGVGGLRKIPKRQPLVAWTDCASVAVAGDDPGTGRHLRRLELTSESAGGCVVRLDQFESPFLRVQNARARPSATPERTLELSMPPGRQTAVVAPRGLFAATWAGLVRGRY